MAPRNAFPHLRECCGRPLPRRCVLEARAERKAIDAFVNEVGLHIEREEKFACVLSLHGQLPQPTPF